MGTPSRDPWELLLADLTKASWKAQSWSVSMWKVLVRVYVAGVGGDQRSTSVLLLIAYLIVLLVFLK